MTDVTPFCWTLERGSPIQIKVVFHCAPGMAGALCRALPPGAKATCKSRARARCGGRIWVGTFLEQEGADPKVVRDYKLGRGETLRRAADALWVWAGGSLSEGPGSHKSIL